MAGDNDDRPDWEKCERAWRAVRRRACDLRALADELDAQAGEWESIIAAGREAP